MNMKKTYLSDYTPLPFSFLKTDLLFDIYEEWTIVSSTFLIRKTENFYENAPLVLNGENLELISVTLNEIPIEKEGYSLDDNLLTLRDINDKDVLKIKVKIFPHLNTELEGLYLSKGLLCTQNEPEGFRKITYFLDRPDAMSEFTVKIIASKESRPVLLSNGNCIEEGSVDEQRHFAVWHDPFLKPCYLFALVAGNLSLIKSTYTTLTNREIDCRIYCDAGRENDAKYAMDALKRSMLWDEKRWGLEYDLDIYMIVAVDAFNMGAMENKGLNIFNSSAALCKKEISTDTEILRVETVICHEYFHNWTGNRITVRDWFQLTLKEGLTVFRDQEFSSDMNDRGIKRIEDVIRLRKRQFSEDSGPNSHPIKPESYIEINNFYTPTIYEKGAEVVRMLQLIVGKDEFDKGFSSFIKSCDGTAATTQDLVESMIKVSGKDLSQFYNWYASNGTPHLDVKSHYDERKKQFQIEIKQKPSKRCKLQPPQPLLIPLKIALLTSNNEIIQDECLEVTDWSQIFSFQNIDSKPLVVMNRGFSAPITISYQYTIDELLRIAHFEKDTFSSYEAMQSVYLKLIDMILENNKNDYKLALSKTSTALKSILANTSLSYGIKAYMLRIPSHQDLLERQDIVNFDQNEMAINKVTLDISKGIEKSLQAQREQVAPFVNENSTTGVGARRFITLIERLLLKIGAVNIEDHIVQMSTLCKDMTLRYGALETLCLVGSQYQKESLEEFLDDFSHDSLVVQKYLFLKTRAFSESAVSVVEELKKSFHYDTSVPNSVRSVYGGFIENTMAFHAVDGSGYRCIANACILLDEINPHLAASLAKSFTTYSKLDSIRKEKMKDALSLMLSKDTLSKNLFETVCNINT